MTGRRGGGKQLDPRRSEAHRHDLPRFQHDPGEMRRLAPARAASIEVPASGHALMRVEDGAAAEAHQQVFAFRFDTSHRPAHETEPAGGRGDGRK